ncbi:MAG: NADPH-dependent F420 reductase [Tolypothrix sp. Co-bin9]|nr:NADPH-dependent F420 reductase [Tolypothrix sp. Co-bin9]
MNISIIGAGNVGQKLAQLIHDAGHEIFIGVNDLTKKPESTPYQYGSLEEAAEFGEIVLFTVPYTAYAEILPKLADNLKGKIVIDITNPINADWSPLLLGEENSAGETVTQLLPKSYVVKAFNTVFADIMTKEGLNRDGQPVTAFVAGNDQEANRVVSKLASEIGFAPIIVGPIKCARYLEAMAHLNIQIAVGMGKGTNAALVYHIAQ